MQSTQSQQCGTSCQQCGTSCHYSFNFTKRINGQSQVCFDEEFLSKVKNGYTGITNMKILLTPIANSGIIHNVESINCVTNSKNESVVFSPGYYTLAQIFAKINTMTYNQIQLITSAQNYGKCQVTSPVESGVTLNLSMAPDIKSILGYNSDTVLTGPSDYSDNIIDITRNSQVVLVYSSFIKSSDISIANQNNNLLTTINIDDPTAQNVHKLQHVWIPIESRFQRVYFTFRNGDYQPVNLYCDIELQLVVASQPLQLVATSVPRVNKSSVTNATTSQFTLYQKLTNNTTVVQLKNPLSFNNCYISEVDVYTDIQLHNIATQQVVKIYGNMYDYNELTATITIPPGGYSIEELLALLNCSDSLWELIYHGANAFRITISGFSHIDFNQSTQLMQILGIGDIDNNILVENTVQEVRYALTSQCNTMVINVNNEDHSVVLQTGNYTWSEFVNVIITAIGELIDYTTIIDYDDYIVINGNNTWYFNRTSNANTIHNYFWLKWYKLVNVQSNILEKPDMTVMSPDYIQNDAFWVEDTVKYMTIADATCVNMVTYYDFAEEVHVTYTHKLYDEEGDGYTRIVNIPAGHYTAGQVTQLLVDNLWAVYHGCTQAIIENGMDVWITYQSGGIKILTISSDNPILTFTINQYAPKGTRVYPQPHYPIVYKTVANYATINGVKTKVPMRKWDTSVPSTTQTTSIGGNGLLNKWVQLAYALNVTPVEWNNTLDITMPCNVTYGYCNSAGTSVTPAFNTSIISLSNANGATHVYLPDTMYKSSIPQSTLVYTLNGEATTITVDATTTTQVALVDTMNTLFANNDLDIMWTADTTGYKLQLIGGSISGTLFNNQSFALNNTTVTNSYVLWLYSDTCTRTVTMSKYICSYPVDITVGLSQLKLYSNIVQSKESQPLLSMIDINSLDHNYYKHDRLCIPCSPMLDKLEFRLSNLDDEQISFNGNIHLLVLFTVSK